MARLARFFLVLCSLFCLTDAAFLWMNSAPNAGLIALTVIGVLLFLYAILLRSVNRLLEKRWGRLLKALIFLGFCFFLFTSALITVSGGSDTVRYDENAVIVLGAGLRDEEPSRVLQYRLDKAVQYHTINPEAYLVVSGAKGRYETVSEAEAMRRYLIKKGVPEDKILCEERATSTYENFLYSKEILDERLSSPYRVAFVTNRFHVYRAGRIAKSLDIYPSRLSAKSEAASLAADYLRECSAIFVMWCGNAVKNAGSLFYYFK